jgi:hypothetical protein
MKEGLLLVPFFVTSSPLFKKILMCWIMANAVSVARAIVSDSIYLAVTLLGMTNSSEENAKIRATKPQPYEREAYEIFFIAYIIIKLDRCSIIETMAKIDSKTTEPNSPFSKKLAEF